MSKYFGGLFLVLTTFDMGIKQYVEETFKRGEKKATVIPGLEFRRVHNKGFFLDSLDKYPKIIKSVSAILGGMIAIYDYQLFTKRGKLREKLGMTILSAGAFSNIFDRLVRGYVVDYFGIKNSKLSKITANLADVYIMAGSTILSAIKGKTEGRNGNTDKK